MQVPESFSARNPVMTRWVLAFIRDAADLLLRLLYGRHSVVSAAAWPGLFVHRPSLGPPRLPLVAAPTCPFNGTPYHDYRL